MSDASRYVTKEIKERAAQAYFDAGGLVDAGSPAALRAALEAVAGDIVAAVRRECATKLREFAQERTGRRRFRDEDDNLDYIDRYASQEALYGLAAEWEATTAMLQQPTPCGEQDWRRRERAKCAAELDELAGMPSQDGGWPIPAWYRTKLRALARTWKAGT